MNEAEENIIGQIVFDEEAGFLIEWNKLSIHREIL